MKDSDTSIFSMSLNFDTHYMPQLYKYSVYHYTSNSAFYSILFGEEDKICLWASRFDCLNDKDEGKLAKQIYNDVVEAFFENKTITSEQYDFLLSIDQSNTTLSFYEENNILKCRTGTFDRYVTSFSTEIDSLAMWKYYSKGSVFEGYNLCFNTISLIEELNELYRYQNIRVSIYPVIYERTKQESIIVNFLKDVLKIYSDDKKAEFKSLISSALLDWGLIFKSNHFRHENEVRIILYVINESKQDSSPPQIKYRYVGGYNVPYIELKISKSQLLGASLGPLLCEKDYKETQKQVLSDLLKSKGYSKAITMYSTINLEY